MNKKWWYALGILFFNTVLSIPPSFVRGQRAGGAGGYFNLILT
jgi:hypothetical protein